MRIIKTNECKTPELFKDADLKDVKDEKIIRQWMSEGKKFLVIQGSIGSGKSYASYSIKNLLDSEGKACFFVCEEPNFFDDTINQKININYDKVSRSDFLIIEDVGVSSTPKDDDLIELIEERYRSMKPTVITTSLSKKNFKEKYGYKLYSKVFAKENTFIDYMDVEDMRSSVEVVNL